MALQVYSGPDWRFGIVEQDVWGTAELDTVDFNVANEGAELSIDEPTLDTDITFMETKGAHGTRSPVNLENVVRTSGAAPKLSLAGIAKRSEFDILLYSMFHKVTEDGTTPFDKTFTFDRTLQPDFTVNSGEFLTFVAWNPISGKSEKVKDLITQQLTVSCAPGEYLKYSAALVGRGLRTRASTPSGTWTIGANENWHYADMSTTGFGVGNTNTNMNLHGPWELVFSQDAIPVGSSSGEFQTFGLVNRKMTFKIGMLHGTATDTFNAAWENQTNQDMRLAWGNATPGTDDGDLAFTWNALIKDVKPMRGDISAIEVSGEMVRTATVDSDPVTVILCSLNDRDW